jgi:hypothetical protein
MRQHRTKVAVLVAIMLGVWGFQIGNAAGTFSCRASLVHVKGDSAGPLSSLDQELVIANAAGAPCESQTTGILGGSAPVNGETLTLPGNLGTIRVLYASTTLDPNNKASAEAGVAKVLLTIASLPTVEAEVLTSQASATCDPNVDPTNPSRATPILTSSSEVARVTVGGSDAVRVPAGGASQDTDLGPIGVLHLNQTESTATSVTQRALFLDTGLVDVTISESSVGYSGLNPCTFEAPKQCEDGNDNDGDLLIDEADPGCHTDGNPNNPATYDPKDDDETDAAQPQCSDGVDNADPEDTLADSADPGCHSDGNAGNSNSYVPSDNDETDAGTVPECRDGHDNDDPEDDLADSDDPDCHSDFDPDNDDSYTPDGSEGCDEIPADTETVRDDRSDNPNDREDDFGEVDDEDCDGSERVDGPSDD